MECVFGCLSLVDRFITFDDPSETPTPRWAQTEFVCELREDDAALVSNAHGGVLDLVAALGVRYQQAIRLDGAGNKISTFGDDGTENSRLWGPEWGEVLLFDADPGNDRTVLLSARSLLSDSGGVLTLFRHDGAAQGVTFAGGGGSGGIGQIYNNAANITVTLDGDDGNGHSLMVFSRSDGTDTVTIEAAETSTQGAAIKLFDSAGTPTTGASPIFAPRDALAIRRSSSANDRLPLATYCDLREAPPASAG